MWNAKRSRNSDSAFIVRTSNLGTLAFAECINFQDFCYLSLLNKIGVLVILWNFFVSPQASFLWLNEKSALISNVRESSPFLKKNIMELSVTHLKQFWSLAYFVSPPAPGCSWKLRGSKSCSYKKPLKKNQYLKSLLDCSLLLLLKAYCLSRPNRI